jgi:hypothetical protein
MSLSLAIFGFAANIFPKKVEKGWPQAFFGLNLHGFQNVDAQ